MDSTGRIHEMTEEQRKLFEDMLKEKVIPIPDEEVEQLKAATVDERLAWYREREAMEKLAFNLHGSEAERNAAKALRRKLREKP